MFSFRNSALLLVLTASATLGMRAQSSDSSSAPTGASSSASSSSQTAPPAAAQTPTPSSLSVQARIRARREQRRAAAIHDVYSHLYEIYVGGGYLRFHPGDGIIPQNGQPRTGLQRINEKGWDVGVTRYFNEKLGVTIDGRGTYGTAFIGNNPNSSGFIQNPIIAQYAVMIGPTYRFLLHPKYSISGRVLGGGAYGHFSGDLGAFTPTELGLYPDGPSVAISASVPVEYNFSPNIGLRVAPEYVLTNFGSTIQNSLGFTGGVVVRWGKQ
jgi:hypothetical protein